MKTIGLGNALVDVLLRLQADEVLTQVGIPKGGMELIDRNTMLAIRKAQENTPSSIAPGGSVANSMRAMGKLGAKVGYIGKLGTDAWGEFYEEELRKAGVYPHTIKVSGESGTSTVMVSPDGERTMATYLGPAATLSGDELLEDVIARYDCIYIEGYLIFNEALLRTALELGKKLGLLVVLDLASFTIVESNMNLLHEVVPEYVDILFSNESEAKMYTGLSPQEAVKSIAGEVKVSVVTMGKEGALICTGDTVCSVPATGGKPVDTTGAGDHFAAGFLYGYTHGATIEQSGCIGSLLAGNIIDVVGAKIPDERWEKIKLKVNRILA